MLQFDTETIVRGYAKGFFLMDDGQGHLNWYETPEQRTLIPLDDRFRYPRSLRRVLNRQQFHVRINSAFERVIEGCADRDETWISEELANIYRHLHERGWAHSFETWEGERLAGGILGIAIGGAFIGESMFFAIPDGSKVAMVKLVEHLRDRGYLLFDAQLSNPHLSRFGAFTVSGRDYLQQLFEAIRIRCKFVPPANY